MCDRPAWRDAWWRDFAVRQTYESCAIENSPLSLEQTREVLERPKPLQGAEGARQAERFGVDYKWIVAAAANRRGLELAVGDLALRDPDEPPLSEGLCRDVAGRVNNVDGRMNYRRGPIDILGAHFAPAPAREVRSRMASAVDDRNFAFLAERNEADPPDPFWVESRFHIQFERIHPFDDGNGRTGRILLCRGLLQVGLPPAIVSFEERDEYFACIGGGDYDRLANLLRGLSAAEDKLMAVFAE